MTDAEIRDLFRYHAPTDRKVEVFEDIRSRMAATVLRVAAHLPQCSQRDRFIELCSLAQMTANQAIAVHGHPDAAARGSVDVVG